MRGFLPITSAARRHFSLWTFKGIAPVVDSSAYVAKNATVMGNVTIKENACVLFDAVIRGDNDSIVIGKNSNVQDGSILHTDEGINLIIGDNVSIGHKAMLHGCTVGDNTIVGMGATIMNRAVIGSNCIIGANALILENKVIPDHSIAVGSPAKVVRAATEGDVAMIARTASNYSAKIPHFKESESVGEVQ